MKRFEGHKFICVYCESIVQSKYHGQFVRCKCGKSFVDETHYYCRSGGDITLLMPLIFDQFMELYAKEETSDS